jgi:hypothetical protein
VTTASLAALIVLVVGLVGESQGVLGAGGGHGWPFGDAARDAFEPIPLDDFVITIGVAGVTPGNVILAGLGTAFRVEPFYTVGRTEFTMLPAFAATQSLETGLEFDWGTASVDVNLLLTPWALVSTGGWLEVHPPAWLIATNPAVTLDGRIAWGPQWAPVGGWSHAVAGALDVEADWTLSTVWESPFDLVAGSSLAADWDLPNGAFTADWMVDLEGSTVLPFFRDTASALRTGATAQVFILPVFGFGFDLVLEFRANAFYAYALIGAGSEGIRAEVGAEFILGVKMFGRL